MAPNNRFNKFNSEKAGGISSHYETNSSASLKIKTRPYKIPKNNRSSTKYNIIQRINTSPLFRSDEEYKKVFRDLSSALKKVCFQGNTSSSNCSDAFGVKLTSSRILRSPNISPIKSLNTPIASPKKYPRTPLMSPVKDEEMSYFSEEEFKEKCNLKNCECVDATWSDDEDNGSPKKFNVSDINDDMLKLEIGGNKYSSLITQVAANMECLALGQMDYGKPVQDLIIDLHPFETAEALLPHSSTYSSSDMNFQSCSSFYKENLSNYRTM